MESDEREIPCEECRGPYTDNAFPGVLWAKGQPIEHVMRCDACERYETDEEARWVVRDFLTANPNEAHRVDDAAALEAVIAFEAAREDYLVKMMAHEKATREYRRLQYRAAVAVAKSGPVAHEGWSYEATPDGRKLFCAPGPDFPAAIAARSQPPARDRAEGFAEQFAGAVFG